MIKLIVYMTVAFLLGGIAAVSYYTFTGENAKANKRIERKDDRFVLGEKNLKYDSMKELDSLTAADNHRFTSKNAVEYSVVDTTDLRRM